MQHHSVPQTVAAVLLSLLFLAGCTVRVDSAVELASDDTAVVDLTVGIMLDQDLPPGATDGADTELTPEQAMDGLEQTAQDCGFDVDQAAAEPYEEDGFMGASVRLDGISLDAVNCFFTSEDQQFFSSFDISREDADFVFAAEVVDVGGLLSGGLGQKRVVAQASNDPSVDPGAVDQEALDQLEQELGDELDGLGDLPGLGDAEVTFELTFALTFPGEVEQNNATQVDGNSASWELDGSGGIMMASGGAESGGGIGAVLPWVLVALLLLAGVGLLIFVLVRSRGNKDQASAGPYGPGQFGQGAPGQPGQWAPQQQPSGQPPQTGPPSQPNQWAPQQPPGQPQQPSGQPQQPPGQPQQPPGQPAEPPQGSSSGEGQSDKPYDPSATRVFRPQDPSGPDNT